MATLTVTPDEIRLTLSRWEKVAGLHGDVVVPRSAVVSARAVERVAAEVAGVRKPAYGMPGDLLIGTWRRWGDRGNRDFVITPWRSPGLVIELAGPSDDVEFRRLLVSVPDLDEARRFAAELNRTPPPGWARVDRGRG